MIAVAMFACAALGALTLAPLEAHAACRASVGVAGEPLLAGALVQLLRTSGETGSEALAMRGGGLWSPWLPANCTQSGRAQVLRSAPSWPTRCRTGRPLQDPAGPRK